MTSIAEQLSAAFSMDAGEVEMEILTLQNKFTSKSTRAHQTFGPLWTQKS